MTDRFKFVGWWYFDILDVNGRVRWKKRKHNMTTLAGLDYAVGVILAGTPAAITTWYMAPINNVSFTALSSADTMSAHAGWTEFANYSQSTRPVWTPGAVAGQSVINNTAVAFTISAAGTLRGGFLTSVNTKNGTTGTLFATGQFDSPQAVVDGETFRAQYQLTATGA